MSMQSVASPVNIPVPPNPKALRHIPGNEGWPFIGNTLAVLADPKGQIEKSAAKYGLVYRTHLFGETSVTMLGPEPGAPTRTARPSWSSSVHVRGGMSGRIAPANPRTLAAPSFGRTNSTIASAASSTMLATAMRARRRRGAIATWFQHPFRFGSEDWRP